MGLEKNAGPVRNAVQNPEEGGQTVYRWYHKIGMLVYILFCFEIGIVLLILPWLELWDQNYFGAFLPELWSNPYFRGAVSGVGILNLAIAMGEVFRFRQFSRRG